MKYLLILLVLISGSLRAQSDPYSFTIETPGGKAIKLSEFKGKKILVRVAGSEGLVSEKLRFLDSIWLNHPQTIIIVIPASDFISKAGSEYIQQIQSIAPKNVVLTRAVKVRKSNNSEQNDLLQWLTDDKKNGHFATEATNEHTYVISESGVLYAVLEGRVSKELIAKILNQPDIKQ